MSSLHNNDVVDVVEDFGLFSTLQRPSDVVVRPPSPSREGGGLGEDDDSAAVRYDVLLYLPHLFGHFGHGNQLQNYITAVLVATFENSSLVLLEPPPGKERFAGGSQFGCPPDAFAAFDEGASNDGPNATDSSAHLEALMKEDPRTWEMGKDFPRGFSRLVDHPDWLRRGRGVPCATTRTYDDWERQAHSYQNLSLGWEPVVCTEESNDDGDEGTTTGGRNATTEKKVLAIGGDELKQYFWYEINKRILSRPSPPTGNTDSAYDFARRLGGTASEAALFENCTDRETIWDFVAAWIVRAGLPRLQPWISRDVGRFLGGSSPLTSLSSSRFLFVDDGEGRKMGGYDAIHVRRGDKLAHESRKAVVHYWRARGVVNASETLPHDAYIPFAHYLRGLLKKKRRGRPRWGREAELRRRR